MGSVWHGFQETLKQGVGDNQEAQHGACSSCRVPLCRRFGTWQSACRVCQTVFQVDTCTDNPAGWNVYRLLCQQRSSVCQGCASALDGGARWSGTVDPFTSERAC